MKRQETRGASPVLHAVKGKELTQTVFPGRLQLSWRRPSGEPGKAFSQQFANEKGSL